MRVASYARSIGTINSFDLVIMHLGSGVTPSAQPDGNGCSSRISGISVSAGSPRIVVLPKNFLRARRYTDANGGTSAACHLLPFDSECQPLASSSRRFSVADASSSSHDL